MERMVTTLQRSSPLPNRRRFGGSVLEMVLVLTILLNLTFGAIEFGYYFFVKNTMDGAAREGVRASIVAGAADSNVNTAADNVLTAAGLTIGQYTITISPDLSTSPRRHEHDRHHHRQLGHGRKRISSAGDHQRQQDNYHRGRHAQGRVSRAAEGKASAAEGKASAAEGKASAAEGKASAAEGRASAASPVSYAVPTSSADAASVTGHT